jgi:hypothetical protein
MINKEKIARNSTRLANVAVLVGFVLVAYELRQNTDQLALELEWQINQKMFENNRDLQNEYTASIYAKSITNGDELTFDEFIVATGLITNLLNIWEDRFFLYQHGLLEDSEWKQFIDEDIGITLGNTFAQNYWQTIKGLFPRELVTYVDTKLPEVEDTSTYRLWLDVKSSSANP